LHSGKTTIEVGTLIYIRRTSFYCEEELLVFFVTIVMVECDAGMAGLANGSTGVLAGRGA
jgi:hypothetical protein